MTALDWDEEAEQLAPLGVVPLEGRGTMPFALVHGESLVASASWALITAGAVLFDFNVPFAEVRNTGRALVLHDPLCPLTSVDFISQAIAASAESGAIVVGVRPVTDTIKEYDGDLVGATIDRTSLVAVASPIVLPASVVAELDLLAVGDFAALVDTLRNRWPVRFIDAPPLARRVADEDDLSVLEALSAAGG
jgi:2-C-methyl-D-erythritol 4-phosphate cytidylyltransferase